MEKVRIVFHPMFDEFGDVQTKKREIECYGWGCNVNYYYFNLSPDAKKVLSIPRENIFYVEDII